MAHTSQHLKIETLGPDRSRLRSELLALYEEYDRSVSEAAQLMKEGEALLRGARAEKRAATLRMNRIKTVLDDEFPDWNYSVNLSVESTE